MLDWPTLFPSAARATLLATISGLLAGFIVGGIGSRVAMRVSALAGGASVTGLETGNGNIVGEITVGGTATLLILGALIGVPGGYLYFSLRNRLPGHGWWKRLAYGMLLLVLFGTAVIEGDNRDFSLFGPSVLNIVMFGSLLVLFGLAAAPIAEWLDRRFAAPSHLRSRAGAAYMISAIPCTLLFLILVILSVRFGLQIPLLYICGLALAPALAWVGRRSLASLHPELAVRAQLAIVAFPCAVGLAFLVKRINEIL